jgi:uncharacterized protein
VRLTIDDMDRLPEIVARVVEEGANELGGVQYDLQNRDAVVDEALQAAVVRARRKAEVMAGSLGVQLGRVINVAEAGSHFMPPPMPPMARMAMATEQAMDASPGAYAAGEIEVRANVSVTWALQ